jgi:hypothetical protein
MVRPSVKPDIFLRQCFAPSDSGAYRLPSRLRSIVAAGRLSLDRVTCSCRPGTEGTPFCNYGRLCAVLKSAGQDVGAILIREGLAVT